MGRVKQALEPGVAAQGGPRFAFQDSQSILFAGQLLLKGREVAGNPFLLGFLMAAGLQQLALDFVDLPPFVAFDALEVLFPGGGLGAEHSGIALTVAGFKPLFTDLKRGIRFGDGLGESRLQFFDLLVELPVDAGAVLPEFLYQLIRAYGAVLDDDFEAVQEFERFVRPHVTTRQVTHPWPLRGGELGRRARTLASPLGGGGRRVHGLSAWSRIMKATHNRS